jgi:NhaP-type Na+/H+ or K+/H+ antiporter
MVFTTVGILLSPLVFGIKAVNIDGAPIQIIAEVTLILVLFGDASDLNLNKLKKQWGIPARLLIIGLPITIIFTTFTAKLFFPDEPFIYLILLALVLAPTDAALGKAVVTNKKIPENIRSSISVESGLNDGFVFPLLITVVVILISETTNDGIVQGTMVYVVQQIIFGAIIGAIVGCFGAKTSTWVIKNRWMENNYENLVPVALAIFSYYMAEYFGGNGFIAAFFSGLFLGNYNEELREHVDNFVQSDGELLIMISFLVFGISFIPATIAYWDLSVLFFSLLSLTVLRMIPVAISLIGKSNFSTMLFIGWFGPRGIASILYVLIIIGKINTIDGHEKIFAVITLTIFLSIFLHGLTAKPFANLYGNNLKNGSKK